MTELSNRPGAAAPRRPSVPGGRHAVGRGAPWSLVRACRATWRLARRRAGRRPAAALVAACGVLLSLCAVAGLAAASRGGRAATAAGVTPFVAAPAGRAAAPPDSAHPRRAALPTALIIPAIGVRTRLIRLGRTAAGALQVPATTTVAGWYTGSPRPGELGAAVIVGHVDSLSGPGVFFRLRQLHPDELILVRRADNSLVAFRIFAVGTYPKARFPTAAVYGPAPAAELRLVTCGGTFDPTSGHYLSNVIIFAVAVRWRHGARPGPA